MTPNVIWSEAANSPASYRGALPNDRDTELCLALLIATLWLAIRPYQGVFHDTIFYTIQALNRLTPERFADDLYFHNGSQDQFTLFSLVHARLLEVLGTGPATWIMTIISQCAWLMGLGYLAGSLFRDNRLMVAAIVSAVTLRGGSALIMQYGEQFVTPRLFAEAMTMCALGVMLRGRPVRALCLLGATMALHPLTPLCGFGALFLHEAARRWIGWATIGAAVALTLSLAFMGVDPFTRLFVTFDPEWWAIVRVRESFCALTEWGLLDWFFALDTIVLAAILAKLAEPRERRLLAATLIVALAGLAVSLTIGDLLRNVLIFDIQPWRAMWMLSLITNLLTGPILLRLHAARRSGLSGLMLCLTVGLRFISGFFILFYLIAVPMALTAWLVCTWEAAGQRSMPRPARLIALGFAGIWIGPGLCCLIALGVSFGIWAAHPFYLVSSLVLSLCALGLVIGTLVSTVDRRPMLALASGLALAAGLNWDQRTPWVKFVDSGTAPASLLTLLPAKGEVYWEGDERVPWFVLKRPSYFSCNQGTGALFSRGTAIAYQQRFASFQPLRPLDFGKNSFCPLPEDAGNVPLAREDLIAICRREPGLGALVLTTSVAGLPQREWIAPAKFEDFRMVNHKFRSLDTDRFYVYTCDALR